MYLDGVYLLDYKKGVHRLRFNDEEDLLFLGFYPAKKFSKFCVYSNNLDDKFELALSSDSVIYEVDWSEIDSPKLINKYSLMPGSQVTQIFLNERFVFVQAASPSQKNPKQSFNYTWVLTRGSRTYTRAFHVFKHSSIQNRIDLNFDSSYLIVIDDERITNYAFDNTNLQIKLPKD